MAQIKLAEYTFDNSVGDVMPSLTPKTITMTKEDTVSGTTTKRIVYIDNTTMPTHIGFGSDALLTLDYLNFTNNITSMSSMFYQCRYVTYINTANWDTSNVTSMNGMFYECRKVQKIDGLENWDVRKNTNFSMSFYHCDVVEELNIGNWKAPSCTNMQQMFRYCTKLKTLDLSGFEVSTTSGVDMSRCFQNCDNLKITGLNSMKVKPSNLSFTFANLTNTTIKNNFDLSTWDTSACTNFSCMFEYSYSIDTINVSNWNMSNAKTTTNSIFNACLNLRKIIGLDTWDRSGHTLYTNLFSGCKLLTDLSGVYNWDVSSGTNFYAMFNGCSSLTELDLRNWVTSSATGMQEMFKGCSGLKVLRVDNFDISSFNNADGTGISEMFRDCKSLKTLNLNSFTKGINLTKITSLFSGCQSLEYISMQNFDFSCMTVLQGWFTDCSSLKMLDLTTLDTSNIDATDTSAFTYTFLRMANCPVYYNSNLCTNTNITSLPNAVDVKGRLMAIYDFNNTVTSADTYPVLTGSNVVTTLDTKGNESYITHRVISVNTMPTAINFNPIPGLLNVDFLAVTNATTNLSGLFQNCVRMTSVNTHGWDTSRVTNMSYMFTTCSSLTDIDLSTFNTSQVSNFRSMFYECSSLTSLDLSSFDTNKVTSMHAMFTDCSKLNSITFSSSFTTASVTSMYQMFYRCTNLTELDLTSFNTKNVTDSSYMFQSWTSDQIVYIHDTNWTINTSSYNATFVRLRDKIIAKYTFDNSVSNCLPKFNNAMPTTEHLVSDIVDGTITKRIISTNGDLPTRIHFADDGYAAGRSILTCDYLDTSNCTSLYLLFYGCNKLTSVDTSSWNTSKVTNFEYAFRQTQITTLDATNIDVSSATNLRGMFNLCYQLESLDLSGWNVSKVIYFTDLFNSCGKLTTLDISTWDTSSAINMSRMFYGVNSLTELDVSHFVTSKVTTMDSMFVGCVVQSLDLSSWDVSKVADMSLMFYQSTTQEINFEGWNTESLTNMYAMFCLCKLTEIDISHFKTSKVTNMLQLFDRAYNLTSVGDLSGWDTSSVTNMSSMFKGTSKITELDLSGWDTRKVTATTSMFEGWGSTSTVYYEPPYWSLGTTTLNPDINWVIQVTRNNGYWLDMSDITSGTTITLFNENNLPTSDILTDWGDGTRNSELTHTYSTAGEYIVVTNLQMGGSGNTSTRTFLTKATIYYKTTLQYLFESCAKLREVSFTDNFIEIMSQQSQNFFRMFNGCTSLVNTNEEQWKRLKPNDMTQTFSGCSSLTVLDLENFDTSEVKSLNITFNNCGALTEIKGIENLDVSSVTTFNGAFRGCGVPTLNLSKWKFKDGVNMYQCFNGGKMTSVDLSNANFKTNLQELFYSCKSLETVNLSGTTIVGSMQSMFSACDKLTNIDFTGATIQPTSLFGTFNNCLKLETIDTSTWDMSNCTSLERAFVGCAGLTSIQGIGKWNTGQVTTMNGAFQACSKLQSLDLTSWNTSKCTNMGSTFYGCGATFINTKGWDTSKVTTMSQMFSAMKNMTTLDLSHFNTDNVKTWDYFASNSNFVNIDISSFVRNSQANGAYMFVDCPQLESIDMSNFTIPSATGYQFRNSTKLKTIGMLYCSADSINNLVAVGFQNTGHANGITIYYYDADPKQLTPVEGVTFKKYVIPTTIQLPPHIQLHSLPDGTKDEVDLETGILTRNVGYVKLDGTQTYTAQTERTNTIARSYANLNPTSNTIITNWLPNVDGLANNDVEGIGYSGKNSTIYVRVSKERIGGNGTQADLDVYLEQHPLEVTYTTTPTTEKLILNYNNSCDYGRILPTGMCDKYDVVNSMYTQTMTSILLDGENTWDAMEEMTNVVKFTATGTTVGVEELNMLGAGGLYCDNDLFPNINDDSDVEHCRVDEAGNKFYIYIDKDRLMSPDLIGWQIWLQSNKFNMIYELEEHLTYKKPYEELDPEQARWQVMDCMRDGAIKYHTNSSDNITMYPTLEYVAPSINNFELTMLEPNTDYTVYAEGINENDTINFGGTDIKFSDGKVFTSGDSQWLRIDNNDSFYNMVVTKGDTTSESVPYFEGITSVENPVLNTIGKNLFDPKLLTTFASLEKSDFNLNSYSTMKNPIITLKPNTKYKIIYKLNGSVTLAQSYTTFGFAINNNSIGNLDSSTSYYRINSNQATDLKETEITTDYTGNLYMFRLDYNGDNSYINSANLALQFTDIYIGESSKTTSHELYKTNTVSYTNLKLRSLPNGVKDTINVVTGEYVQRVGEITFDGSETWTRSAHAELSPLYYVEVPNLKRLYDYLDGLIASKLKTFSNSEVLYGHGVVGISGWADFLGEYPNSNWIYIQNPEICGDGDKFKQWLSQNPITVQYELAEPITTKLDPQTLLAFTDGTINLSSDTGLLPTTHYTVPSTNTFNLPSMKTGTRYTLKYPSASGSITIGNITYAISSDSMLFTTPLTITGDKSAIVFSDANPENVILIEGAYNTREVPYFTGVKSVKNPNITVIDQLSTESNTYSCATDIELRGLPNGVADSLDIVRGKLTRVVGVRDYQEGDENLANVWTDGYETVYALSSPVVSNVQFETPYVTTHGLIELSSDDLIPQLNYRAQSSNNFPLDLLQPNSTYTLYADTLVDGTYTLGGTHTGTFTGTRTITLGDITDNLLTFNGDLGLSNVMLIKGNSLKTTLPKYFSGLKSVTGASFLIEGMAGETNELAMDEDIVLRDCNGIKDVIDLTTGILTKRTGEIVLNGRESWVQTKHDAYNIGEDYCLFQLTLAGIESSQGKPLINDKFIHHFMYTTLPNSTEAIYSIRGIIFICVKKTTIGGDTISALQAWLVQNPTTVIYPLQTPLEVPLENVWTITPPTSYDNQTEITTTVPSESLKPMLSVTIATTTLEEIVSQLESRNAQLEEENLATMMALTEVYEMFSTPVSTTSTMSTMSMRSSQPTATTMSLRAVAVEEPQPTGMTVSPMGLVYANLIRKGFKTIEDVPYTLQAEVSFVLRGME